MCKARTSLEDQLPAEHGLVVPEQRSPHGYLRGAAGQKGHSDGDAGSGPDIPGSRHQERRSAKEKAGEMR